ncbi:MAG: stage II sporulation protein P [Firmicutes bacterium]|nr:stage II sporulation protein P [Bacillota bacterium]
MKQLLSRHAFRFFARQKHRFGKWIPIVLCAALTAGLLKNGEWISGLWRPVMVSAGIVLPEGGEEYVRKSGMVQRFFSAAAAQPESSPEDRVNSEIPTESEIPAESEFTGSSGAELPAESAAEPLASSDGGVSSLPENYKPVEEVQLSSTGNLSCGAVSMRSRSAAEISVAEELSRRPDVTLKDTDEPQVLIVHTHTSEAYMESYTGSYPTSFSARTDNPAHGVIAVGDAIARILNNEGIVTIHDTTFHDDPAYKGAYFRSLATMEKYLEQYPSIQVILDVHRDCLEQADGTKLKPTVTINGKKAAQIMIVSGCDDNGTLGYPDWEYNLRFGLRIQKSLAEKYPGLARPLYCWNIRYNQHLRHGALLVEFGTEANTYDEVRYSGELFADCLTEVLESLKE